MSNNLHTEAINAIESMHIYELARTVEIADPDFESSPGAKFLTSVRDAFIEWVEYTRDCDNDVETIVDRAYDAAHEETDRVVPVYTSVIWETFVDLAAYGYDDAGENTWGDMTEQATYVLARIAEQLFVELASAYYGFYSEADEDADCEGDD